MDNPYAEERDHSKCTGARQMRYSPFVKSLNDFAPPDLANLREVAEGWYVEYKSQPRNTKDLAKSLASFANQYGGWLFLGVRENPDSKTAGSFPGIEQGKVPEVLESIRNAAKDIVRPQVPYRSRTIDGPLETIGLRSNRCVIVVHIPEGSNTPYIHNDGRIYIRIGDSSSPIAAKDKGTFDLLYQRGEDRRSYLKALVERSPELSQGEEANSYIHLSILSDPYGTLGHRYVGTYSDFSDAMTGGSIPFENIFTAPDGFVARQIGRNDRYSRLLTWEFSRDCNSFITIPIPTLPPLETHETPECAVLEAWAQYSIGRQFVSAIRDRRLGDCRVLNLNILLALLSEIMTRHRTIAGQSEVRGPFFIKARIENVWRVVPFIDVDDYMKHIIEFDFPVVQDRDLTVPKGASLETFIVSPERDTVPTEPEKVGSPDLIDIGLQIMQALGIPEDLLTQSATATDLVNVSRQELAIYPYRRFGNL